MMTVVEWVIRTMKSPSGLIDRHVCLRFLASDESTLNDVTWFWVLDTIKFHVLNYVVLMKMLTWLMIDSSIFRVTMLLTVFYSDRSVWFWMKIWIKVSKFFISVSCHSSKFCDSFHKKILLIDFVSRYFSKINVKLSTKMGFSSTYQITPKFHLSVIFCSFFFFSILLGSCGGAYVISGFFPCLIGCLTSVAIFRTSVRV